MEPDRVYPLCSVILTEIWAAKASVDESGYAYNTISYHTTEKAAWVAAKGKGWWGHSFPPEKVPALRVDDRFFILAEPQPVKIEPRKDELETFISSLTPEQLQSAKNLGLI